ncbi:MAG: glutamate racemase [Candidatus Omnitrophota bacterium]
MSEKLNKNYAIGVFDSGLGGLTVVKELIRQLPHEHIVYFGDTARVPYGTKSKESILRFSKENTKLLLRYHVKAIVVACNTSSSIAVAALRKQFSVPIIDVIYPGARKAVGVTKNKTIGVIATQATIASQAYTKRVKGISPRVRVIAQACPLFVPLAEEGWFDHSVSLAVAQMYLKPLKAKNIDTLILGCTHYPLLASVIQKTMGPKVHLIDSAKEVALEVEKLLVQKDLMRSLATKGRHLFLVSDEPDHFQILARRFLGRAIKNVKRVPHV